MQGNIMTQVIKLHAGGKKLIECRSQERSSLYYSLSSHNRLLYHPIVHFPLEYQLQPLSQGTIPAESMFCPQQEFLYFCIWAFFSQQLHLIWDNFMFDTYPLLIFATVIYMGNMSSRISSFWLRMQHYLMSYTPKITCWETKKCP